MAPILTSQKDAPKKAAPSRVQALLVALAAGSAAALLAYVALARTPSVQKSMPAVRPAVRQQQPSGLALQIRPFMRAVSIPLDPAGGATGFLEPGDRVDVFGTLDGGAAGPQARLIVGDARLLTLNARSGTTGDSPATSATLEVPPQGAQALALASARGRLTLALRGMGDDAVPDLTPSATPTPTPAVKPIAPRVTPAPKLPPAPVQFSAPVTDAPALPTITVVRGTQKTTMTVGE